MEKLLLSEFAVCIGIHYILNALVLNIIQNQMLVGGGITQISPHCTHCKNLWYNVYHRKWFESLFHIF